VGIEKCVANALARVRADTGVVVIVAVLLSDMMVVMPLTIGSDVVADATAVTLHPKTINVEVKSCAMRPFHPGTRVE